MNLTVLTATSDRPEAFALSEKYLARQTIKPVQMLVLDDGEIPVTPTLGQEYYYLPEFIGRGSMASKVKYALDHGLIKGDALVFWEDDDCYAPDYLSIVSNWLTRYDLVGEGRAIYYNVAYRWWCEHLNTTHASLCMTSLTRDGFKALSNQVSKSSDPFIDSNMWSNAKCSKVVLSPPRDGSRRTVIGIKSMPGRHGYGGGHTEPPKDCNPDPELTMLYKLIGDDAKAYEGFYYKIRPITELPAWPVLPVSKESTMRQASSKPLDMHQYREDWKVFDHKYEESYGERPDPLDGDIGVLFKRYREGESVFPVAPLPITPPTVEVHLVCFNEAEILPYSLRHYKTFATRIIVHDAHSTDRSREISKEMGAEVVDWNCSTEIDDLELTKLKNECWLGSTADLVLVADVDELLYFPRGTKEAIAAYVRGKVPVIKPTGWELESPTLPTGAGQIYDEIKFGARDDLWYAKPCMWNPKLVKESGIGIGSHDAKMGLYDGRVLEVGRQYPKTNPPAYLLHCHHLGPLERLAAHYDGKRARMCANNLKQNWGWTGDGMVHAKDKRNGILAHREQVIP